MNLADNFRQTSIEACACDQELDDLCAAGESEHHVQFYETDEFLIESLSQHLRMGLSKGAGVVVIAIAQRRAAVEARLEAEGFDIPGLKRRGHYVALDAAETLGRFMRGALPDPELFQKEVGGVVGRVRQGCSGIQAFGEMVALLWAEGNQAGALQLEELWNDLGKKFSFSLLCAYPLAAFDGSANSVSMGHVCDVHSRVLPVEGFRPQVRSDHQREMALLRQKARSLEAEIEHRKQCEEALKRRETELSDFLENAAEGIHQVGPDGTILWANRAEMELLGYKHEEFIGQHIGKFHCDPQVAEEMLERLSRGEKLLGFEARLRHRDGSIRYVSIHSSAYQEGDKFVHTRCFTRDITEQKRAAEILEQIVAERTGQLRETVAQLEAFSYSISHDLRAPLRTMQGYAKALIEDYRGQLAQEAVDYLDRIDKAATRLDRLIRDILAFSKIANGQVELKAVSLTSLLENLMQQHPGFAEARGSILVQLPLQPVMGHETYLTQCLTNLIENALKFVPVGTTPQVVIQTELLGDKARISVSDNGIGIDPEQHAKLFHVFGRAHADKRFPGTGIGLAIVKKAAERMGGKVGLHSEAGRGSTFWIELQAAIANY